MASNMHYGFCGTLEVNNAGKLLRYAVSGIEIGQNLRGALPRLTAQMVIDSYIEEVTKPMDKTEPATKENRPEGKRISSIACSLEYVILCLDDGSKLRIKLNACNYLRTTYESDKTVTKKERTEETL